MLNRFSRFMMILLSGAVILNSQVAEGALSRSMFAVTTNHSLIERNEVVYRTYSNARYNYSILYPASLLYPQGEAENGDGQKFLSKDKKVLLLVFGANNIENDSARSGFDKFVKEMNDEGRVVTYKTLKKSWFVVSGRQSNRVFYSKTVYRGDNYVSFTIEYPASERATYDPIVTRISKSFSG